MLTAQCSCSMAFGLLCFLGGQAFCGMHCCCPNCPTTAQQLCMHLPTSHKAGPRLCMIDASQARALFVVGGNPGVVYCETVPTILHVFAANIQAATAWVCGGSLLAQSALPYLHKNCQQLVDLFSVLCIAPIVPLVLLVSRWITYYRLGSAMCLPNSGQLVGVV